MKVKNDLMSYEVKTQPEILVKNGSTTTTSKIYWFLFKKLCINSLSATNLLLCRKSLERARQIVI